MTRRLVCALGLAGVALATLVAACVGDDPGSSEETLTEAGTPSTDTGTVTDAGGPATDTGTDTSPPADASADAIFCQAAPQLFNPVPDAGPFCGNGGQHCAIGQHCCRNLDTNDQVCASSCDAGVVDIACYNGAECGAGKVCCGRGTVRSDACTYPVIQGLTSTVCAANCSNEFQACANSGECSAKTCTPTRALTTNGSATTAAEFGACL